MITRHEAETQAERCFQYHAAIAGGLAGAVALLDRKALPWVLASLGAGVALHATCLYAIPSVRESILRTTASMMEDLRNASIEQNSSSEAAVAR